MANYVKFRRGTPEIFKQLNAYEPDTLYFIYKEDESTAELYLGSKKISGEGGVGATNLSALKDIIINNVNDKDLLVYDSEQGKWINKTVDEVLANYVSINEPTIVSIENNDNNSHQDLIDEEFNSADPKAGDIVIIKDMIALDKYKHSGYVYDGQNWVAMNGNYNAENVYFDEDFIFTEDVGTITISDSGSTTVAAAGKNLKEFLSSVFAKEENPVITQPTATIKLVSSTTSYEVGTEYTPEYQITFNSGDYSYGPVTGVTATYSVTDSNTVLNTSSGKFDTFIIEDDTNYQITANVNYSDGNIPKTNLQNDYPNGKIVSGSIKDLKTNTVKGHRNNFYGTLNEKSELNSDIIRSLNGKTTGSTFSVNIPVGATRVVIACAKAAELKSVKDVNGLNGEISSGFKKQTISVEGANGYKAIDYNVFVLDYAYPTTTTNIYNVTI